MVGITLCSMIKIGFVSFIFNKGMKLLGKKEMGQIIGFAGLACIGIEGIKLLVYWKTNPPAIVLFFQNVAHGLESINGGFEKIFEYTDKIGNGVRALIP